jgi:hypothetical protein
MLPCPITKAYYQTAIYIFKTGWNGLYTDVLDELEELEEAVEETSNTHDIVILRGFLCADALIREINILDWSHPDIGSALGIRNNSWEGLGELASHAKELKNFTQMQQVEYDLHHADTISFRNSPTAFSIKLGIRLGLLENLERIIDFLRPALKPESSSFSKIAGVGITTAHAIQSANRPQHLQVFLSKLLHART